MLSTPMPAEAHWRHMLSLFGNNYPVAQGYKGYYLSLLSYLWFSTRKRLLCLYSFMMGREH